jgi:hypothetical protein
MQAALTAIAPGLDVSIVVGNASFNNFSANFKVEVAEKSENGEVLDSFKLHCNSFGLKETDLGKSFVTHGRTFTICGIAPRSWKRPIIAKSNGQVYKFSAETVKLLLGQPVQAPPVQPKRKRSREEILNELRDVEGQLSPENLTCDGEAPKTWIIKEGARLRALRRQLVAELGGEPTFEELYPGIRSNLPKSGVSLTQEEQEAFAEFRKVYTLWKRVLQELWAGRQKSNGVVRGEEMMALRPKLEGHLEDL